MTDIGPFGAATLAAGGAFVGSVALTPLAGLLASRFSLLDHPDETRPYKLQLQPVPYLGGLAILLAIALVYLSTGVVREVGALAGAVILLALVGLADDARGGLGVGTKLLLQTLAGAVAVVGGIQASVTGIAILDQLMTVFWLVGVTNAVNIIDNCNGITGGTLLVGSVSAAVLSILQGQRLVGILAATVAGAALGFLPYNFPRARIYMGDIGTLPLGFLLATLAVKVDTNLEPPLNLIIPISFLALPLVNMLVVTIHRIQARQPIYVGGLDSIWHRLVLIGHPRSQAVVVVLRMAVIVAALGVLCGHGFLPAWFCVLGVGIFLIWSLLLLRVPTVPIAAWKGR
jgi:UDP-GlcNAc:undecaprenyl-phosphate/decaprenyl-phosphate GlcNAc-1-phosphate transferase